MQKHEELTKTEKVKVAWKCYIPAGVLAAVSIVSTVCGTKIGLTRQAELISLVTAGENAFSRYRDKVAEKIGKDEEKQVRTEIAQEEAKKHITTTAERGAVYDTGLGDELIWDDWNGRWIQGSETEILKQVAVFNVDLSYGFGTFFPVANWYDQIHAPVPESCIDRGFSQTYRMDVEFRWNDPERHDYKVMTFVNPPRSEHFLNTVH